MLERYWREARLMRISTNFSRNDSKLRFRTRIRVAQILLERSYLKDLIKPVVLKSLARDAIQISR